jgi:hypothetical protein
MVPACGLSWTGAGLDGLRPLPATRALLDATPEPFIWRLLAWAPPVVIRGDRDGVFHVVGNHGIALQARYRIPNRLVPVRQCTTGTSLRRPLPEVAQGLASLLGPLYEANRQKVAQIVTDEQLGCVLSGYSRAQYFRARSPS